MNCTIRQLRSSEVAILDDLLYVAIFIPEGVTPPPRSIIQQPDLQVYVENFGSRDSDVCFVALIDEKIVGGVWVRIMDDYGHIDDDTPSLAIALFSEYRGQGIGTALMETMLAELRKRGCGQVSLSVQRANRAMDLYRRLGFVEISGDSEEAIMVCRT